MKYIIFTLFLLVIGLLITPEASMAQYGQYGQVLGTPAPVPVVTHAPKEAGIEDYLNPKTFSFTSFGLSGVFYFLSVNKKRLRKN